MPLQVARAHHSARWPFRVQWPPCAPTTRVPVKVHSRRGSTQHTVDWLQALSSFVPKSRATHPQTGQVASERPLQISARISALATLCCCVALGRRLLCPPASALSCQRVPRHGAKLARCWWGWRCHERSSCGQRRPIAHSEEIKVADNDGTQRRRSNVYHHHQRRRR